MVIYDSNIWIAYFNKRDSQHRKARELIGSTITKEKIAVTEYILTETCSILLFNAGREIVSVFIEEVIRNKDIEIIYSDRAFFNQTLNLFQNSKEIRLSFIDTSLLFWSRFHEVITFDAALGKAIKKLK